MSTCRRELFVGLIENVVWTKEKLCTYLIKHASTNDDQYITDCQFKSYGEAKFQGKSFAFVTFTDEVCVDRCMAKRTQFHEEYGFKLKRLLPDSITKCERLMSTKDIVIRIASPDPLFTDPNIRLYFGVYGKILDLRMLEEENTAGICFITFEDFDSSDRVLLGGPHYLNDQLLTVDKYAPPEYICSLSQYRSIDSTNKHEIKRWFPVVRNLTDLLHPLESLYKTQLALLKYDLNKQISTSQENFTRTREDLIEFENKYNNIKQELMRIYQINDRLKQQIEENERKNEMTKHHYKCQIEEQRETNRVLQNAIDILQENS